MVKKEKQLDYIPLSLIGKQNDKDIIDLSLSEIHKYSGEGSYEDIRTLQRIQTIRQNILKQYLGLVVDEDSFGITLPQIKKEYSDEEVTDLSFVNWFHRKKSNIEGQYLEMYSKLVPPPSSPQGVYNIQRLVWKTHSGKTFENHPNDLGYIAQLSQHLCARYVRQILTFAGLDPHTVMGKDGRNGVNATDYLWHLPALGFLKITELNTYAEGDSWTINNGRVGDVCVIPASSKHTYGHICILTENNGQKIWVSDFWLRHMMIYSDWQIGIVFRFTGQIIE